MKTKSTEQGRFALREHVAARTMPAPKRPAMVASLRWSILLIGWFLANADAAPAQQVRVQTATESPPHYVGVGAIVQLTVEGLEAEPEPKCVIESLPPELRARLSGISPRVVQQITQSGGQIRRTQRVTYTIQFRVMANQPGEYEIGPFVISQDGTETRVDPVKMSFQEVPTTDEMQIKLKLPETAYPDQRVAVQIQWWISGDTENVKSLNIRSPLFDEFRFAPDPQASRGQSRIPIQTDQGLLSLPASAKKETVDGKRYTVVSAERTMIPSRPGAYELAPITATVELVTKWQRRASPFNDLGFGSSLLEEAFGNRRRAAQVKLFRAQGEPISFRVKPFPMRNRPESFSGAVGSGFSLNVAADRTVVSVGDPIRLTIDLRGDGNIEGAVLPSLSADDGLNPQQFRLPQGDVPGVFDSEQGTKQFSVSVRVLDESINEIPAIAYSWFDPLQEVYQTTYSKPVALRVMPAQVVGADSVVSNQTGPAAADLANAGVQTDDDPTERLTAAKSPRALSLSGADLAIEMDPDTLLVPSSGLLGRPAIQVGGYAMGSLCLLAAFLDRRRRQVDPTLRKTAASLEQQRNRVSAASTLPVKDAAKQVADALQVAAAEFPAADRSVIQALMMECESIAYKPNGGSDGRIDSDLITRALAAINDLKSESESQ
jgi:hypothetical protein